MSSKRTLVMDRPLPFIETNESDSSLELSTDVLDMLKDIAPPISVISIVGKYRTGKSYLMNRFFKQNAGFSLGSTIQSKTKGIWLWAGPHPDGKAGTLILLDTEGLHDVEKGDATHDMKLFSLALLLSRCLLYNAIGTLDDVIIQELHLVTELAENICILESKEETGMEFSRYFPDFFVILRDFFLELEVDGKACTPDEYLENCLKMKHGATKKINNYNAPRECIRAYFPSRKCFVMRKPVNDDDKLRHLERVKEEDINTDFLEDASRAICGVLEKAHPLQVSGKPISGKGFGEMARAYVESINKGSVPCIGSVFESLKNTECQRAVEESVTLYKERVADRLKGKLPCLASVLVSTFNDVQAQCMQHFNTKATFDNDGVFLKKLEEQIKSINHQNIKANEEASKKKCEELLEEIFENANEKVKNGSYLVDGGYAEYKEDKERAVKAYKAAAMKGPMADETLHEFLNARVSEEHAIINADKALKEKEKELAIETEKRRQEEEKAKATAAEQLRFKEKMIGEQASHTEMLKVVKEDFEKLQIQQAEEYRRDLEKKESDYRYMVEQGLTKQAEQHKDLIEEMREDRRHKDQQLEQQNMEMQRLHQNQTETLKEMIQQRKEHENKTDEILKRMEADRKQQDKEWKSILEKEQNKRDEEVKQHRAEVKQKEAWFQQQMEQQKSDTKEEREKLFQQMEQQRMSNEAKLSEIISHSNEKMEMIQERHRQEQKEQADRDRERMNKIEEENKQYMLAKVKEKEDDSSCTVQ